MKPKWVLALVPLLAGCGSSSGDVLFEPVKPPKGEETPPATPPTQLVPGSAAVVGMTNTNWVIYRDGESLAAVELKAGATPQKITDKPGGVLIRGQVVYNFADIDWTTNIGDLSIWTSTGGSHEVGQALYAEGMIAASDDGSTLIYAQNVTQDGADLMIASSDMSNPVPLIPQMGRGSATTCTPSLGFVKDALFIGWCPVGSHTAKLERYDQADGHWTSTLIADDVLPTWSSDENGNRVFFQTSGYEGYFTQNGEKTLIDKGIGEAVMLPDGSALLYNVSDQYRRSSLPNVNPIPIVVTKYAQRAAFSSNFDWLMYSTTVTYEQGTRRDLLLAKTDGLNATPNVLVADPVAGVGRSAFTQDGKWALYLIDITKTGATLVMQPVDGGDAKQIPNVVEVAAAHDSTIVFTANQTDPEKYPVLADLMAIDLAKDTDPKLLEPKTVDGRGFALDEKGYYVVYTRSDPDGTGPLTDALYFQSTP